MSLLFGGMDPDRNFYGETWIYTHEGDWPASIDSGHHHGGNQWYVTDLLQLLKGMQSQSSSSIRKVQIELC
ncbi:MAG: hypothetical protein IH840_12590 [Candidatus Heimdallarchaeota archaeon]|nr:hypothetical protein [Candidatus Heimdallarchaeota archaeon]